jgi:hypothetical protein
VSGGVPFARHGRVLPLLGRGVFGLMARVREIAQGLEIVLRQRHEWSVTPRPAPAVALNAADEPLAVVVDLDERAMAVGAVRHRYRAGRKGPAVGSALTFHGSGCRQGEPNTPATALRTRGWERPEVRYAQSERLRRPRPKRQR